jgi:hypothetical protein
MIKPNDGGPAFPVLKYEYKATGNLHPSPTVQSGMSLRDWFAGMALQGLIASQSSDTGYSTTPATQKNVAKEAYSHADAMLAEREKGTR